MFNRSHLLVVLLALCAGLGLWAGRLYFAGAPAPVAAAPAVDPARLKTVRLHPPQAVPAFALQQSDGSALEPAELRGRWTLVFLGFTHCPDVCPTTLQTLAAAQQRWQALPEAQRPRVLFVSVDPERDSATRTGEYAAFFSPDTLAATAPEPALSAFAAGLGLVYMKVAGSDGDYSMDHSATLVLVDPQGRRAGLVSPPFVAADIADDLALLAQAAP